MRETTTAFVTGADRGIGFELVRRLRERGSKVIAGCLAPSPELTRWGIRVEQLDVANSTSVATLAERLKGSRFDLLINNAGIAKTSSLAKLDESNIVAQFQVNAMGTLRTTAALQHHLVDGAKVAIITSRMGSIGDNTSGGRYGYRMSKAALNAAGKSLSHDLAHRGIAVGLFHPGYVRTQLSGGHGTLEPNEAAAFVLERIDALSMTSTGRFLHINGEELPS